MANLRVPVEVACSHLKRRDPVMRRIIGRVGPCTLKPQRNYFQILVRSIISQQISTAAAKTILGRLRDHVHPDKISPEVMARLNVQSLRSVGLSLQKASYAINLTRHVTEGSLNLKTIQRKSDEVVVQELTQVKGIGVWTAHMFMIFALGRLDVLPVNDFAIRSAIQKQFELSELPRPEQIETIAEPWRPFASIASWYLWRSLEAVGRLPP